MAFSKEVFLMRSLTWRALLLSLFALLFSPEHDAAFSRAKQGTGKIGTPAPAVDRPVKIDLSGETILPNGRLITPLGRHVKVAPHPYGLALSPDGKTLVTANSGTHPFSASIITQLDSPEPQVDQIPPGFKPADADPDSVFLGVAVGPDNRTLYLSEGNNGRVGIFDLVTHQRLYSLSLDGTFQGKTYANSLTAALQLSPDGRRLYVLDLAHFRLVILDTDSKQIRLQHSCRTHAFRISHFAGWQVCIRLQCRHVPILSGSRIRRGPAQADRVGFSSLRFPVQGSGGRHDRRGKADSRAGRPECARGEFALGDRRC